MARRRSARELPRSRVAPCRIQLCTCCALRAKYDARSAMKPMHLTPTATNALQSRLTWWPFLAVAAVYAVVALQQITLPGVYMDAVNPDYMAALLLHPKGERFLPWL